MAKRELSNTLKNLKFMQRAALREDKSKNITDDKVGDKVSCGATKRCVVILEGDPHPGAVLGRMSFGNFNPVVDKLKEEASDHSGASDLRKNNEDTSFRGEDSTNGDSECLSPPPTSAGNNKRKQHENETRVASQKKLQRLSNDGQNSSKSPAKQPMREQLNWNVLRPKSLAKKG